MGYRRKVRFQDQDVWGEEVDFETEKENWNTYLLEDGTRLKMKAIVSQVVRLVDIYKQDGEPIYMVNSQNIVVADVPENLRKKLE